MAKKKREPLVVASKVKAYVMEIDRSVGAVLREVRTLDQRFPGNGDIELAARLGREDLARAYRTLEHIRSVIDSCGQYLAST